MNRDDDGLEGGPMRQCQQKQRGELRADYATCDDFCQVFENNMNQLYLLAFLLTAKHQAAEQCFVRALEKAAQREAVFRGCVRSWTRRSLIKDATRSVFQEPRRDKETHDQWWGNPGETGVAATIDAVTQLATVDRFVFVMSVLEGHSIKECSLLLDCAVETVIKARMCALHELRVLQPIFTSQMTRASRCLGATA